jgi:outer membrane biosynthesis protein TonB
LFPSPPAGRRCSGRLILTIAATAVACLQEAAKKEEVEKPKEAAAAEEKKKDDKPKEVGDGEKPKDGEEEEKKKEDAPPPPPPPPPEEVEMRVYMHCEGCARKVKKILRRFDGNADAVLSSAARPLPFCCPTISTCSSVFFFVVVVLNTRDCTM